MHDKGLLSAIFVLVFTAEIILLSKLNHKQGVIITTKGDTISCLLKNEDQSSLYYKTKNDSVYRQAGVESIKEYQFTKDHQIYRSIVAPGGITPIFMLLRDTGKVNLYAFYERIGKAVNLHLYAMKADRHLVKVFSYNRYADNKTSLAQLIADNQQAQSYLNEQKKYTDKVAITAIKIYNGENPDLDKK